MDPVLLNRVQAGECELRGGGWTPLADARHHAAHHWRSLWRAGVRRLVNQLRRWSASAEATSGMRMQ